MVLARRLMRLVGCGVTLQALAVQMAGSHRGFLTILGHTRPVGILAGSRITINTK
jgi:hypothetical protein